MASETRRFQSPIKGNAWQSKFLLQTLLKPVADLCVVLRVSQCRGRNPNLESAPQGRIQDLGLGGQVTSRASKAQEQRRRRRTVYRDGIQGGVVPLRIGSGSGWNLARSFFKQIVYASMDGVGFLIWRHAFKMAAKAMRWFQAAKCCHLANGHTASVQRLCSSARQFLLYSSVLVVFV